MAPLSLASVERLSSVLVFAMDVRSGSVEDLLHGSKFGEVCWIFPESREQFRLSGQLHLVISPTHPLSTTHQVAPPFASTSSFPKLDWEQVRKDVWRKISSVRRASFTWPTTHHQHYNNHHHNHTSLKHTPGAEAGLTILGGQTATVVPSPHALQPDHLLTRLDPTSSPSMIDDTTTTVPPEPSYTAEPDSTTPQEESYIVNPNKRFSLETTPHLTTMAFTNFCLLLLDVDGADHVQMQSAPHARTKYRRTAAVVGGEMHVPGEVVNNVGGGEVVFSVDAVIEEGVKRRSTGSVGGSLDTLVKKVETWSVTDVLTQQ
ncbi:hypothetical protein HDU98_007521 [Podochytrium sp. JEL0797]|nr:hypothetical protein HDU98_007521 [Podochytrium sp. JEL0797]